MEEPRSDPSPLGLFATGMAFMMIGASCFGNDDYIRYALPIATGVSMPFCYGGIGASLAAIMSFFQGKTRNMASFFIFSTFSFSLSVGLVLTVWRYTWIEDPLASYYLAYLIAFIILIGPIFIQDLLMFIAVVIAILACIGGMIVHFSHNDLSGFSFLYSISFCLTGLLIFTQGAINLLLPLYSNNSSVEEGKRKLMF